MAPSLRHAGALPLLLAAAYALVGAAASAPPLYRWGTLRPNVYFGMKARVARSPLFGLMWYSPDSVDNLDKLRHDCDERDHLSRYGWLQHDGRSYGVQELLDPLMGVNLTISYVQLTEPGAARQGWLARVEASRLRGVSGAAAGAKGNLSFAWYMAAQDPAQRLEVRGAELGESGVSSDAFQVAGSALDALPAFTLHVLPRSKLVHSHTTRLSKEKNEPRVRELRGPFYSGLALDELEAWRVKPPMEEKLKSRFRKELAMHMRAIQDERGQGYTDAYARGRDAKEESMEILQAAFARRIVPTLSNSAKPESNVLVFQKVLRLPFTYDFVLTEGDGSELSVPSEAQLAALLASKAKSFEQRFEEVFGLRGKGVDVERVQFAQAALSNLLGGIGHFYGNSIVQRSPSTPPAPAPPSELLCTVPSRSFFPRGFMWDEGFHQLLVGRWDAALSREILRSWFALVDETGWVAREQILGEEARSRVPQEFQVQRPSIANPPTLLLALLSMLGGAKPDADAARFAFEVLPHVMRNAEWYLRTQRGHREGAFAWQGRSVDHCLASGLDDFPRAPWLSEDEGHVDLHSWMVMICRAMDALFSFLAEQTAEDDSGTEAVKFHGVAQEWRRRGEALLARLDQLHWSEKNGSYCDFARHPNTTDLHFVCHDGYVTLFPFLLGLVPPDSPRLRATLELLSDQSRIFAPFGLLSLSKKDPLFGTKENYWRGNVWINVNYLAVRALHRYGFSPELQGPYSEAAQTLYRALRKGLVDNLYGQYKRTGYLWEQYAAKDGAGLRSHPFTGWSSLVVLLMAELYP
jgi:mannosyl-oligosaccharide glucosidase